MNDIADVTVLLTYLRARATLVRRDDAGVSAVEWAIIVSLGVAIALAVFGILIAKARETSNSVPVK